MIKILTEVFQYFRIKTDHFEVEFHAPHMFEVPQGTGNTSSEFGLHPKMRKLIDELTDKFSYSGFMKDKKLSKET